MQMIVYVSCIILTTKLWQIFGGVGMGGGKVGGGGAQFIPTHVSIQLRKLTG